MRQQEASQHIQVLQHQYYIYKDDKIICKIVIEENELKWIFNIKENNSLTFLPKYEYIENNKLIIITNNKYEDIHINILLERID